jgi:exopolyphosphatase / guanosine-5'-triphosphate,3'-diphosphate pyrophosphatase
VPETSPIPEPAGVAAQPRPVAVIEVGTTSIRMAIAEVNPTGAIRILESLSQGVTLGKDSFTRGELGKQTIEDCVRVLKAYRRKLEEYGIRQVDQVRVVATSAVREALNQMAFLDRIYIATGLTVQPIDEAEVHRITYRSIQPLLAAESRFTDAHTIIGEVGGGSTELLVVERGNVKYSHTYRLGSLRLRQSLQGLRTSAGKIREIIELECQQALEDLLQHVPATAGAQLLTLGGEMRFAARQLIEDWDADTLDVIDVRKLEKLTDTVVGLSEEAIVRRYHLTLPEAETLGPALLINLQLAKILSLEQVTVSVANLRDGLLREMGDQTIWTEDFRNQIIHSALELGRKYEFDEQHARHVAELSKALFGALKEEHGIDARGELVLYLAALLHEIGGFISHTSLHKHSMYLIEHSDLFGLSPADVLLVALVARYHRRASPKPTHREFSTLDRDRRVTVSKLAAILRIAIALDASRTQRVRNITCQRERSRLVIGVPQSEDLSVEQLALRQGRSLFEEIYGFTVLLRAEARQEPRPASTQL